MSGEKKVYTTIIHVTEGQFYHLKTEWPQKGFNNKKKEIHLPSCVHRLWTKKDSSYYDLPKCKFFFLVL